MPEGDSDTSMAKNVLRLALLATVSSMLFACTLETKSDIRVVEQPLVIDTTDIDPELADYLTEIVGLIHETPYSAALRGRLAMSYDVNAFRDNAIAMYQQASDIDPFDFTWHYFRAILRGAKGEHVEALLDIQAAIEIDPGYVPAWLHQGTWLFELGRNDEARAAFNAAARLGAGSPAVMGLARIEALEGNHELVVDLLQPYEWNNPHPEIYRLIARSYAVLGNTEEAEVAAALGANPTQLEWIDPLLGDRIKHVRGFGQRLVTAQNLLRGGRIGESMNMLEELYRQNPDDEALISSLAWAYQQTEQYQRASDILTRGIEKYPEQYRFYTNLGYLMLHAGHADDAEKLFNKSIELHGSNSDAYEQLGITYMHKKQYEKALDAFEQALQFGSRNNANILLKKGTIEGLQMQWDAAIETFQRVVKAEPQLSDAHVYLSYAYTESKQFDEARASLAWAQRLGISQSALQRAHDFLETSETVVE